MDISENPRLLFISRAYPPIIGGLENQNYELSIWLPKVAKTNIIVNKKGKNFLSIFLPYAAIKALFMSKEYDILLLGDGVLGIVGWIVKIFHKKPVVCVVHGLDLTYKNCFYQKFWLGFFLKKMDKLIAVGNETISAGIKRGLDEKKFVFIPNGVDIKKFVGKYSKTDLEEMLNEKLTERKIILTTGRLAAHKGIDWFCENVVPNLSDDILYLIAGDGEKRKEIEKIITKKDIAKKVRLLGRVSEKELRLLYNTADLYVKPNIKVNGTMEGFGIVVIEAASCNLTVIASDLEGLKDAIKDGENGFLIESKNSSAWTEKVNLLLNDNAFRIKFGEKACKFVCTNFSWEKISQKYIEEIKKTLC
jgi:phosphatidylinositol alpha-1,6-mannosyltransferase